LDQAVLEGRREASWAGLGALLLKPGPVGGILLKDAGLPDVAVAHRLDRAPAAVGHNRPLRGSARGGGGGQAGAQAVAGVASGIEAGPLTGAFQDAGDALVGQALVEDLAVAVDRPPKRPIRPWSRKASCSTRALVPSPGNVSTRSG